MGGPGREAALLPLPTSHHRQRKNEALRKTAALPSRAAPTSAVALPAVGVTATAAAIAVAAPAAPEGIVAAAAVGLTNIEAAATEEGATAVHLPRGLRHLIAAAAAALGGTGAIATAVAIAGIEAEAGADISNTLCLLEHSCVI